MEEEEEALLMASFGLVTGEVCAWRETRTRVGGRLVSVSTDARTRWDGRGSPEPLLELGGTRLCRAVCVCFGWITKEGGSCVALSGRGVDGDGGRPLRFQLRLHCCSCLFQTLTCWADAGGLSSAACPL